MQTVATPPAPGTLPEPDVTPYFRRVAAYRAALELAAAERGLPPEPWSLS